jgi:hypothetical protein
MDLRIHKWHVILPASSNRSAFTSVSRTADLGCSWRGDLRRSLGGPLHYARSNWHSPSSAHPSKRSHTQLAFDTFDDIRSGCDRSLAHRTPGLRGQPRQPGHHHRTPHRPARRQLRPAAVLPTPPAPPTALPHPRPGLRYLLIGDHDIQQICRALHAAPGRHYPPGAPGHQGDGPGPPEFPVDALVGHQGIGIHAGQSIGDAGCQALQHCWPMLRLYRGPGARGGGRAG